jgi:flagellar biosynthesis protein FlhF
VNQVHQFIAADTTSALAQIHEQLGPDAVVLSVRPLPAQGMARLFPGKKRIEVLASLPDRSSPTSPAPAFADGGAGLVSNRWRSVAWLEAMGLLPQHAGRLQELLNALHASPPASLEEEWIAVSAALESFWRTPPALNDAGSPRPHVFVGPPGSGKTSALCKWLTLAVLTEQRLARVWRLDGSSANTSEFLTIHGEVLGVSVERFWSPPPHDADLLFIDLPGVESHDTAALLALRGQLASIPGARVHLVLNAAYETTTLLAQWNAFSVLAPEDLIFTHLDEDVRRIKLWNFVFEADCGIRFLSAGQKVPGEFLSAAPQLLFPARVS